MVFEGGLIMDYDASGLIVKSDIARSQLDQEIRPTRIEIRPERPSLALGGEIIFFGIDADDHSTQLS